MRAAILSPVAAVSQRGSNRAAAHSIIQPCVLHKMASSRDREDWMHIFKIYKNLPHLWDKNNINYGNRSMMRDGYKILTRAYRERLDKQASVGALRMKMKNLRTTYYRELRKIKDATHRGEKYTPSLWYFENLNFLGTPRPKEISAASKTVQNDSTEDSAQNQDVIHLEVSSPVDDLALENSDYEFEMDSETPQPKTSQRTESQTSTASLERQPSEESVLKKTLKDEHWEVIGKSIGYQLKDLNKKQYTIVSKSISDAIYYGRLNRLTEASHIEIGPSLYSYSESQSTRTYTPPAPYNIGFHSVDVPTDRLQTTRFKQETDVIDED